MKRPTQEEIDARYEAARLRKHAVRVAADNEGLPERGSFRPRKADPAKPMGSPRRRKAMEGKGG